MIRRRIVALVSAVLMLAIGGVAVGGFVAATQSERGREWIRRGLEAQLARTLQGRVHLGTLSGSFLTDLRIDSLLIADRDDSVFVASGPIRLTYDPRDLADGRLIFRTVELERPYFAMRREADGRWSHQKLWPPNPARRALRRRSAIGAVFLLEQVTVRDGVFALMLPDRRDEAAAVPGARRPLRVRRWLDVSLDLPRVQLAYPHTTGRHFEIAHLAVNATDPPFDFRSVRGEVHWVGDSIDITLDRFELPGSTGRAAGRIWGGRGNPVRFAIRVHSDSVALADVAWISDAIPTTGGGRMVLDITNTAARPEVLDYALTDLDVRSHRSRLSGRMTWGIGGAVTTLRDVDLNASPLDVELLERFNRGPFPVPLRGQFTGRVRASGGPLDRFVVDDLTALFRDANVEGAVARARGRGELDILDPGNTTFRGFDLALTAFDLRTAQALDRDFPRLNGTLSGTARLDSSWLDVRLRDADFTLGDGDAAPSRLRGTARIDWGEGPIAYELDAAALPLSFTAIARSFPSLPLRGEYSGPIRVRGTLDDLTVVADIVGEGGRVETDMRLDTQSPAYRVTGRGTFSALDPRRLFGRPHLPAAELNGRLTLDVRGDSLANLRGESELTLDRSAVEGARIFAGLARARFADGRAELDTLYLESTAIAATGSGALGLHAGRSDTLRLRTRLDSLGGLRPWLGHVAGDSIAGAVQLDARAVGWVRDFAMDATVTAGGLLLAGNTVQALRGTAHFTGLPTAAVGTLGVSGDSLRVGGFALERARVDAEVTEGRRAMVQVAATGDAGTLLRSGGSVSRVGDTLTIGVDSLSLTTALHRWRLLTPAHFVFADSGFRVDSLDLRADGATVVRVAGQLPAAGAIDLRLSAVEVPMADIAELFGLDGFREGWFDVEGALSGSRAAPTLVAEGALRQALVLGVRLDTLRAVARVDADQLDVRVALGPRLAPTTVADAMLPLRFSLDGRGMGMRPDGPISGRIRSDSLGLEVFESLTRGANGARGRLAAQLTLGGTWARPSVDGGIVVRNGTLAPAQLGNVTWGNVEADIGFVGDSIAVRRLSATTGPTRAGRASITGWLRMDDRADPLLDLRFTGRDFHIFNRPDIADVDLSGELQLSGSWLNAVLRGALTADRAVVSIPELASKDVISLDEPDRFGIGDSTALVDRLSVLESPPAFVEGLTIAGVPIAMGRDVWLRSSEANINLGGSVLITRGLVTRGRNAGRPQLALDGPLQTVRGTYRLNLGPVQRTFEVEGGEIRFYGDPDLNPTLDITALHTVRQYSEQGARPDVRVRVHLGGTLLQPTAELSTPDSVRVTNSDLISYLVTGGPSFEIGGRSGDLSATAARVVLGSLGSVLGGKVPAGVCDDAQLSTAGLEGYGGPLRQVGGGILAGMRFNCAKQVGDRAFVRLDAGLCQVGQFVTQNNNSPLSFTDALGVKLDYLLGPNLSASIGVEPPTSAVLCSANANTSARGFVPTPRQVGFDLFRFWRF
ncbi:MAG: translocation/assembly module TamB domain-containing protein [Gemmatimonadaceae bacterium]